MKRKTGLILCTLVTLLSGCTPDLFKGMESTGKQSATIDNLHPYYSTTGQTTLYSIEMNVRGNTMNGVLSVLPEPDGSVRTAFTTVFGFTLFDLNIGKDSMQVYECLPQMKSKLLRKMLEKDLRILFFQEHQLFFSGQNLQTDLQQRQQHHHEREGCCDFVEGLLYQE